MVGVGMHPLKKFAIKNLCYVALGVGASLVVVSILILVWQLEWWAVLATVLLANGIAKWIDY